MNLKRVVIPAAGLGTRFLPYTKSIPKEMLPILNRPAIEYVVQEAIDSGINNFCIITSKSKKAISDYFSLSSDFNRSIDEQKLKLLSNLDKIINHCIFSYVNQETQLGLGHAILMVKDIVDEEYFGVMLPDDILVCEQPGLHQLKEVAKNLNAIVVAVQEVPKNLVSSYGIIEVESQINSNLFKISNLIEKPNIQNAPSNLAIIGRYILPKGIFEAIEKVQIDSRNEIQLTDAILDMLKNGHNVYGYKIQGQRHDIGIPMGWLNANIQISKII